MSDKFERYDSHYKKGNFSYQIRISFDDNNEDDKIFPANPIKWFMYRFESDHELTKKEILEKVKESTDPLKDRAYNQLASRIIYLDIDRKGKEGKLIKIPCDWTGDLFILSDYTDKQ
jgi:hypothetical protein